MRKGKKIISVLALTILIVNLLGCNNKFSSSENSSTSKPEESISVEETTTFTETITDEELEKIHSDVNIIIQSLNDRDINQMKSIFEESMLEVITSFDERMEYVFDMLDGKIISMEEYKILKSEIYHVSIADLYTVEVSYDIYTETQKYILDVRYVPQKNENFINTGVYAFEISDLDRDHMCYEYGGIITHRIPCVFSTDMQTIEYNRDELWSYYSQREEIVPIMASSAAAVELSKAGIKKIHIESFEVHESGWMSIILVDELNYRYLVETDEYGYIQFIYENDENGRLVFYWL